MHTDPLEELLASVRQGKSSTLSEQVKARMYRRILWRLANERQLVDNGPSARSASSRRTIAES